MAIQVREVTRIQMKTKERTPALAASGVRKAFRSSRVLPGGGSAVCAVDSVSLEVGRGEIYGLLGANGSGKSTLIRLFSTLLTPDAGEVRVFGLDIDRDELAVKRLINRVSVEASFFKKLSAMENLVYAGRLYGVSPEISRPKILTILRRLGIEQGRVDEPLEKLSRGMQQKVAIARAFLSAPMLLLLDEPTTGLDIRSKREVQTFVRDLRDEHDATILLTTHDLDEASRLADRIGILHGGRLVAEGASEELIARHGAASLEDVFMALTGRRIDEADERGEGETIAWERWEGTIEYTFMAPVPRLTHLLGMCGATLVRALAFSVAILAAVALFVPVDLSNANVASALVLLATGAVAFIGLAIGSAVFPLLWTEKGLQMAYIVQAVVLLVSGVYYPTSVLPEWMQLLSVISPATYVIRGMRAALLDGADLGGVWPDLWPALLVGAVSIPLGLRLFVWAERYAKRTGRLKRSG